MKLSNMANVLRAAGIKVVEVNGWASRGYAGEDLVEYRGNLWHHTATNRAAFTGSNAPTLSMCINGRPDLAGPLCNGVLGRDGTVYLVAAGKANHAGRGSAYNIPTDAGNYYLFGWEMESSGVAPWDWTQEQLEAAPLIAAATERAYGVELEIGHLEYSSEGKIDPAGWPGGMDGFRASVNAILAGTTISTQSTISTPAAEQPKEWDEMASEAQIESIVRRVVWGGDNGTMIHNYRLGRGEYPETILGALEGRFQNEILPAVVVGPLQQQLGGLAAKVDALATALAAKPDNPLTKEEALAQLDASVKASFGEYTPVLVKSGTVAEGAPSNG